MGAQSIGRRLLATWLLGLLCTGCTPTPSLRDLSTEETQGDPSSRLGESSARTPQTTATKGKPRTAKAAATGGVEAADGGYHDVLTRIRLAYFDLLKARRERDTMEFFVDSSEKALQTALSLEKRDAVYGSDVRCAKDELEQNKLKKEAAVRRVEAAEKKMLTVLERLPTAPNRLAKRSKETDQILLDFDWQTMLTFLRDSSTELQAARALIAQQEKLLGEATNQPLKVIEPIKAPLPTISSVPKLELGGAPFTMPRYARRESPEPPLATNSSVPASEPGKAPFRVICWYLGFEPHEPELPALANSPDLEPRISALPPRCCVAVYAFPLAILSDNPLAAYSGRPTFGPVIGLDDVANRSTFEPRSCVR